MKELTKKRKYKIFGIYLKDGHYGGREVVKIGSGCFVIKIKPVVRKKKAREDYGKLENVLAKSNHRGLSFMTIVYSCRALHDNHIFSTESGNASSFTSLFFFGGRKISKHLSWVIVLHSTSHVMVWFGWTHTIIIIILWSVNEKKENIIKASPGAKRSKSLLVFFPTSTNA